MVTEILAEETQATTQPILSVQGQLLVLENVPWQTYVRLLRLFANRHLRITYDQGALEIMAPLPIHERLKLLFDRFINTLAEELGWNIGSFGSTTFKSRKHKRGLEPDQCYWIQNEPAVRGQDNLDLSQVPPPDLAIEIDINNSSVDRMEIYATLGVPEVWRYDGRTLTVYLLNAEGAYSPSSQSRAFPFLPLNDLANFVELRSSWAETDLLRQFRAWVRERIAANWQ
jgi:Uma2 family endonuclease